jgi:hypothetical protein
MSARRAFDSFGPAARRGASRDGMTCLGEVSDRGHLGSDPRHGLTNPY